MGVLLESRHHLHAHRDMVGLHRRPGHPHTAEWSQHLGWFRHTYDDDRWVWSPRVEQMHGYRPGTVAPSTMLVLSHVHPAESAYVAAVLDDVPRTRLPFSSGHRIIDADSRVHDVVMVGAPCYEQNGTLTGLQGFYLDLTPVTPTAGRVAGSHTDDHRQWVRAGTRC